MVVVNKRNHLFLENSIKVLTKSLSVIAVTAAESFSTVPAVAKDIVDTAVSAGKFTTLVAAVKAAGLVDTLKSKGPFTVFAPTDEAFAKLPDGTVETLLKPENKKNWSAFSPTTSFPVPLNQRTSQARRLP